MRINLNIRKQDPVRALSEDLDGEGQPNVKKQNTSIQVSHTISETSTASN